MIQTLFMQWIVAFSLVDELGIRHPRAVAPEHWPPHWWWECECGIKQLKGKP